ncbi:hypothetical protein RB195_014375 [Necator americanus]|uniref:Uncharacterized protein n=1 Tax=Necator americanus TaxID=51031 RepID=A0ABR1DZX8_NECAM
MVETSSYVYGERSMNMENELEEELNRRMRAVLIAFTPVREATDQPTKISVICSTPQFFQRSVTQLGRGQTPLPRLGSYSLPTEPLRDVF